MKQNSIRSVFKALCEDLANATDACCTEIGEDSKTCAVSLIYSLVKLEFVYREKENTFIPSGTLWCRVYPNKNRGTRIVMPEVFPYVGVREFRASVFPYIESAKRMECCFAALADIVRAHLPAIEDTFSDPGMEAVKQYLTDIGLDPDDVLNGEDDDRGIILIQNIGEGSELSKYITNPAYYSFLTGSINENNRYYRRGVEKGKLTRYELDLWEFVRSPESRGFVPVSEDCFSLKSAKTVLSFGKSLLMRLKCGVILYVLFSVLCCLTVGIIGAFYSKDALYSFGAPWYSGFLPAALPAIIGAMAFYRETAPLFSRRNSVYRDFRKVTSPGGFEDFSKFLTVLAGIAAVVITLSIAFSPIRFFGSYFECPKPGNDSLFPERVEFAYDDVECMYYLESRYDPFGDLINSPSYVMVMKDGSVLDFDGYGFLEETERKVVPILKDHGVRVETVQNDRDVPGLELYDDE